MLLLVFLVFVLYCNRTRIRNVEASFYRRTKTVVRICVTVCDAGILKMCSTHFFCMPGPSKMDLKTPFVCCTMSFGMFVLQLVMENHLQNW